MICHSRPNVPLIGAIFAAEIWKCTQRISPYQPLPTSFQPLCPPCPSAWQPARVPGWLSCQCHSGTLAAGLVDMLLKGSAGNAGALWRALGEMMQADELKQLQTKNPLEERGGNCWQAVWKTKRCPSFQIAIIWNKMREKEGKNQQIQNGWTFLFSIVVVYFVFLHFRCLLCTGCLLIMFFLFLFCFSTLQTDFEKDVDIACRSGKKQMAQ